MANALVIHKDRFPQSQRNLRAPQYVRMSTEFQQYSIENQAVVIAAYAQIRNLSIVRTYRDEGESGLTIKNRMGLTQLVSDVQSGNSDVGTILVYDVSRWGRFRDVDESAYYEFICKQGGIKVAYCAEQFQNDGSLISQILKNIKRVMAAKYSRELSAKVYAGESRFAKLGFKMGGRAAWARARRGRRTFSAKRHSESGRAQVSEHGARKTPAWVVGRSRYCEVHFSGICSRHHREEDCPRTQSAGCTNKSRGAM
jgi:DNA invertase Pin-like site-specific DNA recombinase